MRIMYETTEDIIRETSVIKKACNVWGYTYRKNPCYKQGGTDKDRGSYKIDYTLYDGIKVVAWCEVKTRKERFEPYLIGAHKIMALKEAYNTTGVPSILLIEFEVKGIYWVDIGKFKVEELRWFQDNRSRDITDGEPSVCIPISKLIKL